MNILRYISVILLLAVTVSEADARTRIARRRVPSRQRTVSADSIKNSYNMKRADTTAVRFPEPAPAGNDKKTSAAEEITVLTGVSIFGEPEVSIDRMFEFVHERNAEFTREIAEAYYNIGLRYGIRGDIALCQAILETGWFRFADGTAVRPEQHNYCGLGVTRGGMQGSAFDSVESGVTAQIQHLYAYACSHDLPEGEKLIDPRFHLVSRGVAPTWEGLNRRWAANDHYSERIMKIFSLMSASR